MESELEQAKQKIAELSDVIVELDIENTRLKDIINSQNWDASPFEKDYVHYELNQLRKRIFDLERDLNTTTTSRNMFMNRNAELIRSNNGMKSLIKKHKLR
jgi:predicted RNase H-like nuclease (RuvC/YqgF family)